MIRIQSKHFNSVVHLSASVLFIGFIAGVLTTQSFAQNNFRFSKVSLLGSSSEEAPTELMLGDRIRVTAHFSNKPHGYVSTRILINGKEPGESVFMKANGTGLVHSTGVIGFGVSVPSLKAINVKPTDSITIKILGHEKSVLNEMHLAVIEGRRAIAPPQLPTIQVAPDSTPMAATCIFIEARQKDLRATQRRYAAAERSVLEKATAYLEAQEQLENDPTNLIAELASLSSQTIDYATASQSLADAKRSLELSQSQHADSVRNLEAAMAQVYINKLTYEAANKGDRNAVLASAVIAKKQNIIDGAEITLKETTDIDARNNLKEAINKRKDIIFDIQKIVASATSGQRSDVKDYDDNVKHFTESVLLQQTRFDSLGVGADRTITSKYRELRTKLGAFEQAAREAGMRNPPGLPPFAGLSINMGSTLARQASDLRRLRHAQVSAIAPTASALRSARHLALTEQMRLVTLSDNLLGHKARGAQQAADAVAKIGHPDKDAIVASLQEMRREFGFYQKFCASLDKNGERGVEVAEFLATNRKGKEWMGGMVGKLRTIAGPVSKSLDAADKTAKIAELALILEKGNERDTLNAMATFFDLASSAPGFGGLLGKTLQAGKAAALKADALVKKVTTTAIQRESRLLYDRAEAKLYRKSEIHAITNRTVTEELVLAVQLRRLQHLLKQ
ncbi:MAG: hypothetical protein P1V35_05325 [Planctomycetota bacterium]|nr:hypothetical protein [Planctomycetota bacterium]